MTRAGPRIPSWKWPTVPSWGFPRGYLASLAVASAAFRHRLNCACMTVTLFGMDCVNILNHVKHDDGLICVKALMLTVFKKKSIQTQTVCALHTNTSFKPGQIRLFLFDDF